MTFWKEATPHLQAPLDQQKVKPAPQGKYGDYVDGFHVIEEANRIFGHGGWDYTITSMEMVSRVEATDRNNNPQIRVGYRCTVRAAVGIEQARVRDGAAVGTGMAKPENEADAHESAVKEAETDALKRALRTFGYTFGLALYDKSHSNVQNTSEIERQAQQQAAAQKAYDDLIVYLNETDDESIDGFTEVHKREINALKYSVNEGGYGRPDLFTALGKEISGRKAAREEAA